MENLDSKDFNTSDDFQQVIDKFDIQKPTDFQRTFPRLYDKLVRLGLTKSVTYHGKRYNDLSYLKLPSDFQKFIDENDIECAVEFDRRFGTIYCRLCRLGYCSKVTYRNPKVSKEFDYLKTKEDYQNYIDTNNIQNRKELHENHETVERKLSSSGFLKDIVFPNVLRKNIKENTLEEFQKFVDDHNILNATDFNTRYKSYYTKMVGLKLSRKIKYPEPKYNIELLKDLSVPEDFQEFIRENDIQSSRDLLERFPPVYHKMSTLKYHGIIYYPDDMNKVDLSYLNSVEDFQKFIDENKILSATHLLSFRGDVYRRMQKLGICGEVVYPENNISRGERQVARLLDSLEIEYDYNRTADFLSGKTRLDFRIDKYKFAIEYQGLQHFCDIQWSQISYEEQHSRDILKHQDCVDAGYLVLYAVFPEKDRTLRCINFDELNYLDKIYTTIESLKSRILEIVGYYENYNEDVND